MCQSLFMKCEFIVVFVVIVPSFTVADTGGKARGVQGTFSPGPVKYSHKKMAAEHGGLYFMFLNCPLLLYAFSGSASDILLVI